MLYQRIQQLQYNIACTDWFAANSSRKSSTFIYFQRNYQSITKFCQRKSTSEVCRVPTLLKKVRKLVLAKDCGPIKNTVQKCAIPSENVT